MTHNTALGQRGEQVAAEFLAAKGYHILHRNWRCGHREVDIIATDPAGHLVFVEVKTRSSTEFGMPEAGVTKNKRQHFRQAGEVFLLDHTQYPTLQFDVISVLFRGTQVTEVKHFEADWY